MENEYYNQLFLYPDEKLIKIVTTQREEFVPEVVAAAEDLLRVRDYEIEFEGPLEEPLETLVKNQKLEIVETEDFQSREQGQETVGSLALLFASIIFGAFGLICGYSASFIRIEGWLSCLGFLMPTILCLYFRNGLKNREVNP